MKQPECFVQKECEHVVCKLEKSIHGVKKFSRQWYHRFHDLVVEDEFLMLDDDRYLYTKRSEPDFEFMAHYIDYILIVVNNMEFLTRGMA